MFIAIIYVPYDMSQYLNVKTFNYVTLLQCDGKYHYICDILAFLKSINSTSS